MADRRTDSQLEFDPDLEAELMQAMQRVDAPAGFAGRVAARVRQQIPPARSVAAASTNLAARGNLAARSNLADRSARGSASIKPAASIKSAASVKPAVWPGLLLLAASLLLAVDGALQTRHQQKMRHARQIAGQFDQALAVTAKTLDHVDVLLSHAPRPPRRPL